MSFYQKKYIDPMLLRPTVIDVDLDALHDNFQNICKLVAPSTVMPVVKANAYGHGLVTCAKYLEDWGAKHFAVGIAEEGIELREAGIKADILVFGGLSGGQIKLYLNYDLDITASSLFKVTAIDKEAQDLGKVARLHLKIDTGMERIGVHYYTFKNTFKNIKSYQHCQIVGVYSHLAAAMIDRGFTDQQIAAFADCAHWLEDLLGHKIIKHIGASAGALYFPESRLDLVRAGIALYGVYPGDGDMPCAGLKIRPVMKFSSKVVFFKVVKKGTGVGYDITWKAPEDTRIVTIPVGYGDGYSRGLSNQGTVLIRGQRYPIVGRVCMDQMMVNIGRGEAFNGDEVVLLGRQENEEISVNEIAKLLDTNTHEVLTLTHPRVPRRYHFKGEHFVAP